MERIELMEQWENGNCDNAVYFANDKKITRKEYMDIRCHAVRVVAESAGSVDGIRRHYSIVEMAATPTH